MGYGVGRKKQAHSNLTLSGRERSTNDDLLDLIFDPNRKDLSAISSRRNLWRKQASRVFEIEIFDQIGVYTGSRPLRVNIG